MRTVDEIIADMERRIADWARTQTGGAMGVFDTPDQEQKFAADVEAVIGLVYEYGKATAASLGIAEHQFWRDRQSFPAKAFFQEVNHWRKRQARKAVR